MPDKPRLQKQEIRELTDCTVDGTTALNIVLAARSLGFPKTRKYNLLIEELAEQIRSVTYPIVFVGARLDSDLRPQPHYAVVTAVSKGQ